MTHMATYKNPWHTPGKDCYGPAMYQSDVKPFEHAGCLIYERIVGKVWDVVKDGICQTQRAGKRGAMEGAELVSSPVWEGP
jgi:hypothetical protein